MVSFTTVVTENDGPESATSMDGKSSKTKTKFKIDQESNNNNSSITPTLLRNPVILQQPIQKAPNTITSYPVLPAASAQIDDDLLNACVQHLLRMYIVYGCGSPAFGLRWRPYDVFSSSGWQGEGTEGKTGSWMQKRQSSGISSGLGLRGANWKKRFCAVQERSDFFKICKDENMTGDVRVPLGDIISVRPVVVKSRDVLSFTLQIRTLSKRSDEQIIDLRPIEEHNSDLVVRWAAFLNLRCGLYDVALLSEREGAHLAALSMQAMWRGALVRTRIAKLKQLEKLRRKRRRQRRKQQRRNKEGKADYSNDWSGDDENTSWTGTSDLLGNGDDDEFDSDLSSGSSTDSADEGEGGGEAATSPGGRQYLLRRRTSNKVGKSKSNKRNLTNTGSKHYLSPWSLARPQFLTAKLATFVHQWYPGAAANASTAAAIADADSCTGAAQDKSNRKRRASLPARRRSRQEGKLFLDATSSTSPSSACIKSKSSSTRGQERRLSFNDCQQNVSTTSTSSQMNSEGAIDLDKTGLLLSGGIHKRGVEVSLAQELPALQEGQVEDEIWENQRWQAVAVKGRVIQKGWGGDISLLPTDRANFSDRLGRSSWPDPSSGKVPVPTGWKVVKEFSVDRSGVVNAKCDAEGWAYHIAFPQLDADFAKGTPKSETGPVWVVRRRRWYRRRARAPPAFISPSSSTSSSLFNDADGPTPEDQIPPWVLMQGWLGVRSHKTKRWKSRYTVVVAARPHAFGCDVAECAVPAVLCPAGSEICNVAAGVGSKSRLRKHNQSRSSSSSGELRWAIQNGSTTTAPAPTNNSTSNTTSISTTTADTAETSSSESMSVYDALSAAQQTLSAATQQSPDTRMCSSVVGDYAHMSHFNFSFREHRSSGVLSTPLEDVKPKNVSTRKLFKGSTRISDLVATPSTPGYFTVQVTPEQKPMLFNAGTARSRVLWVLALRRAASQSYEMGVDVHEGDKHNKRLSIKSASGQVLRTIRGGFVKSGEILGVTSSSSASTSATPTPTSATASTPGSPVSNSSGSHGSNNGGGPGRPLRPLLKKFSLSRESDGPAATNNNNNNSVEQPPTPGSKNGNRRSAMRRVVTNTFRGNDKANNAAAVNTNGDALSGDSGRGGGQLGGSSKSLGQTSVTSDSSTEATVHAKAPVDALSASSSSFDDDMEDEEDDDEAVVFLDDDEQSHFDRRREVKEAATGNLEPFEMCEPMENLIFDIELGVDVDTLRQLLFVDDAFNLSIYGKEKYTEVSMGEWTHPAGQAGSYRNISYVMPRRRIVPSTHAHIKYQYIQSNPGEGYQVDVFTTNPEVPYGTKFVTGMRFVLVKAPQQRTRLLVSQEVTFVRNVIVKGFIKSSVKKEVGNWYNDIWCSSLRAWLDKLPNKQPHITTTTTTVTRSAPETPVEPEPSPSPADHPKLERQSGARTLEIEPPVVSKKTNAGVVLGSNWMATGLAVFMILYLLYTVRSLQMSVERLTMMMDK